MTNRWHNILGNFDWNETAALFKRAEDAGLDLTIIDDSCPCCGFRPSVIIKDREKNGNALALAPDELGFGGRVNDIDFAVGRREDKIGARGRPCSGPTSRISPP